jgi:hypothetical protein
MGYGGYMSGGGSTVTRTELDPNVVPYVQYGLSEAKNLYQQPLSGYYPGQTYIGPSAQTQAALQATQARALGGSPLTSAAQQQAFQTVQGNYLAGNPFFEGAYQPAARAAQTSFYDAMQQIGSQASRAGRYGSGAMGQLQDRASGQLAQTLADTAGKLAYENYAQERARQQAMIGAAPSLAEADYSDINRLLAAGQGAEQYQQAALESDIAKYNYLQNQPQARLQQYLSAAYGSPMGGQTISPTYRNPLAGALGGAALGQATGQSPALGAVLGGLLG